MVSGMSGAIQLIDYDGMFVEEIRDVGSAELGQPNFQHPERRSKNPFGPTIDRFSPFLSRWPSRLCTRTPRCGKRPSPITTRLFFGPLTSSIPRLPPFSRSSSEKPALETYAQGFASICRAPFERTPSLDDFLAGGGTFRPASFKSPPSHRRVARSRDMWVSTMSSWRRTTRHA